jgi:hypothetical protein
MSAARKQIANKGPNDSTRWLWWILWSLIPFPTPMWDSENERLGFKARTPVGYAFRGVADLLGAVGLITILPLIGWLVFKAFGRSFSLTLLWLLLIPFGFGMSGKLFYGLACVFAMKRTTGSIAHSNTRPPGST